MNRVGVRATLAIVGASLQFAMSTICAGQQPRALTPLQVVEKFLAAKDAENWKEAAEYLDIEPIERTRQGFLRMSNDTAKRPRLTAEEIMKHNPDMPRVVAEYQIKESEKAWGSFDPVRYEFADVKNRDALARLTPAELAVSWIKARSFRYRMSLATTMAPECPSIPPSAMPKEPHSLAGFVQRGARAYVVDARVTPEDKVLQRDSIIEGPPDLYELRYISGQWKLRPPYETSGFAVSCDIIPDSVDTKVKK